MQSRMDKYNFNKETKEARSNKNKNLYSEVYNADFYTELAELENTNEVDLSKIKEILQNREDYQKTKNYKDILSIKGEESLLDVMEDDTEEKNYDVNSILEKAKEERRETENYKKATTEYDILKKLNLLSIEEKANDMLKTNKREEDRLRELIDTITMKKEEILDASENEIDFLEDLKGETTVLKGNETYLSGDTTIIDDDSLTKTTLEGKMIVVDNKKDKKKQGDTLENRIDKSFFTTSLSLSKKDFEDINDNTKSSKSIIAIKILLFIVILIISTIGLFVANTYLNL